MDKDQCVSRLVERHPLAVMSGMVFGPVDLSDAQIQALYRAFEKLFADSQAKTEVFWSLFR